LHAAEAQAVKKIVLIAGTKSHGPGEHEYEMSGLALNETADKLELLQPDATRRTLLKKDIDERAVQIISPMPAGLVKKPHALRDLPAYLLSKNPLPP
jgi:hypothetical protein